MVMLVCQLNSPVLSRLKYVSNYGIVWLEVLKRTLMVPRGCSQLTLVFDSLTLAYLTFYNNLVYEGFMRDRDSVRSFMNLRGRRGGHHELVKFGENSAHFNL